MFGFAAAATLLAGCNTVSPVSSAAADASAASAAGKRDAVRENQNGWIGHNGNTMSYMAYPYSLPSERTTMVVLLNSGPDIPGSWMMIQDITRIISPNNLWPGLPK